MTVRILRNAVIAMLAVALTGGIAVKASADVESSQSAMPIYCC